MMPLSSFLSCHWRHKKAKGYASVLSAAQKLDQEVWDTHGIKLLFCSDPWQFRDMSTAEVERGKVYFEVDDRDPPQLGTHADPTCRYLNNANFFALIGTATDRPLPLYTMNTAALYEPESPSTICTLADIFMRRRIWSDFPDRDCADLDVDVFGLMAHSHCLPAVFLGTAWTRQDRRRRGIMHMVSKLHRFTAYLRYGPLPQFATIVPDREHDKLFEGRDIGCVIETRDGMSKESRVLFYTPADIEQAATRVLTGHDHTMNLSAT